VKIWEYHSSLGCSGLFIDLFNKFRKEWKETRKVKCRQSEMDEYSVLLKVFNKLYNEWKMKKSIII